MDIGLMRIIDNGDFISIFADEGKVICSTDGIWDIDTNITEVALGIDDSVDNYYEEEMYR